MKEFEFDELVDDGQRCEDVSGVWHDDLQTRGSRVAQRLKCLLRSTAPQTPTSNALVTPSDGTSWRENPYMGGRRDGLATAGKHRAVTSLARRTATNRAFYALIAVNAGPALNLWRPDPISRASA